MLLSGGFTGESIQLPVEFYDCFFCFCYHDSLTGRQSNQSRLDGRAYALLRQYGRTEKDWQGARVNLIALVLAHDFLGGRGVVNGLYTATGRRLGWVGFKDIQGNGSSCECPRDGIQILDIVDAPMMYKLGIPFYITRSL